LINVKCCQELAPHGTFRQSTTFPKLWNNVIKHSQPEPRISEGRRRVKGKQTQCQNPTFQMSEQNRAGSISNMPFHREALMFRPESIAQNHWQLPTSNCKTFPEMHPLTYRPHNQKMLRNQFLPTKASIRPSLIQFQCNRTITNFLG